MNINAININSVKGLNSVPHWHQLNTLQYVYIDPSLTTDGLREF